MLLINHQVEIFLLIVYDIVHELLKNMLFKLITLILLNYDNLKNYIIIIQLYLIK
jgi:hypothetical protein